MKQVNTSATLTMAESMLQTGHVVKDKWQVINKIGQGAFGEVYKCKEFKSNRQVALKLVSKERIASASHLLKLEVTVLKELQGKHYFPKFVGFGKTERFDYLVMELLGPSLSELKRHQPERRFSLSTTLRLGYMMLKCIHSIHKAGYLHRDIKPSNFTIGIGEDNRRRVYLLDFGLARQYVLENGEVRPPRYKVSFHGTPRYASLRVLQGKEAGRQDDLMSLFYTLSEFSFSDLPWKQIRDYREMAQAKESFDHQILVKEFPDEFQDFYSHISGLTFFDKPDYELLYSVFDRCIKRRGVKDTDPFDFEEGGNQPVSNYMKKENTSSVHSKSLSDILIIGCASYEESEKIKGKEQIKRSKSTSNNLHHLITKSGLEVKKDQLLRSKSSNNMMNKKNINNYYNNSKDTGFSVSPFNTNSHCQPSTSISIEPESPVKISVQNLNKKEAKVKLKSQSSVESNKHCMSQQSESLFMDTLSKENFSFETSKAENSQLRQALSLNKFLKKESILNRTPCFTALSALRCYKDKGKKQKTRHSVRRSVSHPASIPSHLLIKSIFHDANRAQGPQGLPRCWSCPTISLFIRSDLKPPLKQQASFDENVYEVDVMRNVAAKQLTDEVVHVDCRRNSLPLICTTKTPVKEQQFTGEENKEQAQDKISNMCNMVVPTEQKTETQKNRPLSADVSKGLENSTSTQENVMRVQKSLSDSNVSRRTVHNNVQIKYDPQIKNIMIHNQMKKDHNALKKSTKVSFFTENDVVNHYNIDKNIPILTVETINSNGQSDHESNKPDSLNLNERILSECRNTIDAVIKEEQPMSEKNCDNEEFAVHVLNNTNQKQIINRAVCETKETETSTDSQSTHEDETAPYQEKISPYHDLNPVCRTTTQITESYNENNTLNEQMKEQFSEKMEHSATPEKDTNNTIAISQTQTRNNSSLLVKENDQNETYSNEVCRNDTSTETKDQTSVTSLQKNIDTCEQKQVHRRHRANSENKYVKDESELKLNFTRRRQRPSSAIYEEKVSSEFFEDSEPQKYSTYCSPYLIRDKVISGFLQNKAIAETHELLQPPPDDPPADYCLPSRYDELRE
ncbi:tau-tubulin kinase homolog Asator [Trichonephila clavata]|uniref:non-specific serine/threonine protein kinase n=1 Tax=Trichonephila clavata TaxID=2740835 RepID=A0A8X6KM37_TRICU|nr:tau-tubulin kinase homolog Asator [Trichonephila clavata]